jgi:putative transposase
MPDYRRHRVPGGTYFFIVNLLERRPNDLRVRHIDNLRGVLRSVRKRWPFHMDAWVVLPDHLHCVWTLPPGDDDFANRRRLIKQGFSKGLPTTERRSAVRVARGERGIRQRRFWEHAIRDDEDYAAQVDYCHINPTHYPQVRNHQQIQLYGFLLIALISLAFLDLWVMRSTSTPSSMAMRGGWRVAEWPFSTFHRYVEAGVYPLDWAGELQGDWAAGERA